MRRRVADRERTGIERRKSVHAKRQSVEGRNNSVTS